LVGLSLHYGSLESRGDLYVWLNLILATPASLTTSYFSYVFIAYSALASCSIGFRERALPRYVIPAAAFVISLCTLLPVSQGALGAIWKPGPWSRCLVAPCTLMLIFVFCANWSAAERARRFFQICFLSLVVSASLPAKDRWNGIKSYYELEVSFIRAHPDRLVASRIPVGWYLEPLFQLTGEARSNFIPLGEIGSDNATTKMRSYGAVWRFNREMGEFRCDQELFAQSVERAVPPNCA
jgi:hypothetical protein